MVGPQDPRFKNEVLGGNSVAEYLKSYAGALATAISKVDQKALESSFSALETAIATGAQVFVAGNGGSAAIANHLCCDWTKGTRTPRAPTLRTQSLVGNSSLFTAIANDHGYDKTFSEQLSMLAKSGDVAILISSSGNSPNMLEAARAARQLGLTSIALTGFSGGQLQAMADIAIHVPASNYGIVEDCHQMIMHSIAQFLAKKRDQAKA